MRINTFYIFLFLILCILAGLAWFLFKSEAAEPEGSITPQPSFEDVITNATSPFAAPTGLSGIIVTSTQVNLLWDAIDSPLVSGYRVSRNGRAIADITDPRFGDDTVTLGSSYEYYVQTLDNLGRLSLPSKIIVVKVTEPAAPLPVVTPSQSTPAPAPQNTTNQNAGTPPTPPPSPTPVSVPKEYTIAVTESGTFQPKSQTIRLGDSVTFTYDGSGDEVELLFSPSISTSVKLDHEFTSRTVIIPTPGTYTFQMKEEGLEIGTIIVQP